MRRATRGSCQYRREGEGARLSLAVRGKGGFRHIAGDDRIAHEMDAGLQRRLERDRINRTPPRSVSETRLLRELPSLLRRDDVGDRSLERLFCRYHRSGLDVDRLDPAGEFGRKPFYHSRVMALPGVLEQVLPRECALRVEHKDLRPWLMPLEIGRNQGRTLVRGGRAAEWIWRNDQHENTTVLHTLQLFAQQLGLCARLPCMGHDLHRRRGIAVARPALESDTRSQYHAVVSQLCAAAQADNLRPRSNHRRGIVDDGCAVLPPEGLITRGQRFERAEPGEIEGAEEAGRVKTARLVQGNFARRRYN